MIDYNEQTLNSLKAIGGCETCPLFFLFHHPLKGTGTHKRTLVMEKKSIFIERET